MPWMRFESDSSGSDSEIDMVVSSSFPEGFSLRNLNLISFRRASLGL